jgi:uncharacterized protein
VKLYRSKAVFTSLAVLVSIGIGESAQAAGLVISQVYGGGGNTGATLTNDFIELFNSSNVAINLAGYSVQYAASTGSNWSSTNLTSFFLNPGQYYLIQELQGAGGTQSLPTPDAIGTIALSATAGKVALVSNTTLIASGTLCPVGGGSIVDFLGYGSATNCSEGAPTANLSNTTAAFRNNLGFQDTNNNLTDFSIGAPAPRNSAVTVPEPSQVLGLLVLGFFGAASVLRKRNSLAVR